MSVRGGGRGVPLFALISKIPGSLARNKTLQYRTYVHICCIGANGDLPQKEAATPGWDRRVSFLLLNPVYALEGYWTARVREGIAPLVMGGFRFGNAEEAAERDSQTF